MVESSKILTVSYGTFSCTLEGFDDSFGTMKAIAEYFRDLAQGDRYFGAEPPAPDAEMLTRIAEKEIARRVEARADESGIVLRAVDALQTPAAAPAMPPVATPPTEEDVAEVVTTTADEADVAEATPEIEDIAESSDAATADTDGDVAGQEVGDDMSPTLVASSPAAYDFTDSPIDDEMDASAPEASFEDMAPDAISTVPAHPDANSIAAKLQRIRAVVGSGAAAQSETAETNFSDSFAQEADDEAPSIEDSFEEMTAEVDIEEDSSDEVAETAEAAEADVEEVIEDDTAEDTIVEAADDSASDSDGESEYDAASTEDEAAHDDAELAVEPAEDEAIQEDVAAEDDTAEDANADMAEAEAEQPKQSFRARILRVAKKTRTVPIAPDLTEDDAARVADQTVATDDAQSLDEDTSASEAEPTSIFEDIDEVEVAELAPAGEEAITALSDEDEAELLADLAAVEAEVAENAPEVAEDTADVEAPETVTENVARSSRNVLPVTDDAAMSRIMDQADEQLSEPEGSRRRSAIAQLKAAVAATEAARQLGDKADDAAAKESAFRDDLNDAVRPGAATALPRTEVRAERPRPAPLKLVASQRVDEEEAASAAAPVLPRRVSSDTASDAGSFTDFAAEMGATELPDLLEAAAAYTAYVEGIEDFSRPQIMKKVQASAAEEFSREDGLRSFGTLLRQGRISKVRNGRFQVSDQTRFKPEQKAG